MVKACAYRFLSVSCPVNEIRYGGTSVLSLYQPDASLSRKHAGEFHVMRNEKSRNLSFISCFVEASDHPHHHVKLRTELVFPIAPGVYYATSPLTHQQLLALSMRRHSYDLYAE